MTQPAQTAKDAIDALVIAEDKTTLEMLDGLEEIQERRAPWTLTEGPVDKQRVRDAIRQLECSAPQKLDR